MREFVNKNQRELLQNEGEGGMGEGEEEAGPKTQGEEGEAGWERRLKGPMGTDEVNIAIDEEMGPPRPINV